MRFILIFLFIGYCIRAEAQAIEKYEALFIANFVKHIEWPNAKGPIKIGVLGNSRVLPELNSLLDKGGHNFTAKRVAYLEESDQYDLVFIPKTQSQNITKILKIVYKKESLLVAEDESLSHRVVFSFFMEGNKLRFHYNRRVGESKSSFRVSEQLIKYANIIE